MRRVLFVCTGNVFRSLTAEYALRNLWGRRSDIVVASAGTEDFPHVVARSVRDYLLVRGLDVSRHRRRTLTAQILQESGPVIAMSTEHRSVLAERFNRRDVPLFTEACGLPGEPLPDVNEAVRDYETNPVAVDAHVRRIIDRIIELTPQIARRLLQQKSF
jgi:protein-tyrosine phosphatase